MSATLVLLLAAAAAAASLGVPTPPPPPVMPTTFSANLTETIRLFNRLTVVQNRGAWFYDFPRRRMRFDHLEGQWDPLCVLQGLSPRRPHAACRLVFSNDSSLYVLYPGSGGCCRACGATQGCSVLRPDWLRGAAFAGEKTVAGRRCRGWKVSGAFAEDYWYTGAADGRPCQYYEAYTLAGVIPLADKSLSFDPASFSPAPPPDAAFDVPARCRRPCRVSYHLARRRGWFRGAGFAASGM